MNWYKKATQSLFKTDNLPKENQISDAQKIYNYIKSKNLNIQTYHGTSLSNYIAAQRDGYLLFGGRVGKNLRGSNKDFVYVSTNKNIAAKYAQKIASNSAPTPNSSTANRTAVVVPISLPLYAVSELRSVIFGIQSGQNENLFDNDLNQFISNKFESNTNMDATIQQIYTELKKQEELTVKVGIPLKWSNGPVETIFVYKPIMTF